MTSREWEGWMAFAELEPFGPAREDMRAGTIASAAVAPHAKKGECPAPKDFFPDSLGQGRQEQSPELMELRLQAWAAMQRMAAGE